MSLTLAEKGNGTTPWFLLGVLGLASMVSIAFLLRFAFPYVSLEDEALSRYAGRQIWIVAHVATGSVALLIGPFQLWMGMSGRVRPIHRQLGIVYLISIGLSSACAFYLASTTQGAWVFSAGLSGLGLAWVITSGLAYTAIRRRLYLQHREWMIRSYVVTLGFVFFRIFVDATTALEIGTQLERISAASWFCWAIPLLIAEAILQWRKMGAPAAHT